MLEFGAPQLSQYLRVTWMLSAETVLRFPDSSKVRMQISKIVKRFYNARSGVVHGSRKKRKDLSPTLVEAMDRLMILLYLTIAKNHKLWSSTDDLRNWCDMQRWGNPTTEIEMPYSRTYLKNAIDLGQKR